MPHHSMTVGKTKPRGKTSYKKSGASKDLQPDIRLIIDSIPGFVWSAWPTGEIEFQNKYYTDYVGIDADDPAKFDWQRWIHPEDLPRAQANLAQALTLGVLPDTEARLRRADGVYRWFLFRGNALRDKQGRIVRWYGVNTDIDDLKRAREQSLLNEAFLNEAQARFRDYAETASDWFWEIGSDYKFTRMTDNAFGSDAARRIGTSCWDHALDLETEPEKWRLMVETLDARKPFRDFVYLAETTTGPMYVKASGKPIFDAEGEFRGYRGTGTNVTDITRAAQALERARANLERASRATTLGVLTASIAHEITQPLSGILMNSSTCLRMLAMEPPNLFEAEDAVRLTLRDANRASDVIAHLRTLYSKKNAELAPLDLNTAVREMLALSSREIEARHIALDTQLTEPLALVFGDRVQLQQVILNFVLNAADAMRDNENRLRSIVITTEEREAEIELSVSDTGVGIAPEAFCRLFDPFYTTKVEGMGIGLSISRSIIENHGGRLWASNNDEGGATFHFSVPRAEPRITQGYESTV